MSYVLITDWRPPLNLVQKWLGYANLTATAIYSNAAGAEEKDIANRMLVVITGMGIFADLKRKRAIKQYASELPRRLYGTTARRHFSRRGRSLPPPENSN